MDDSIPITWSRRWRTLKLIGPVLAFITLSGLLLVGSTAFKSWVEGLPFEVSFFGILIAVLVLPGGVFLISEMQLRISHRSKRILEIGTKGIIIRHYERQNQIPWTSIYSIQIEPITGHSELSKINILFVSGKKSKIPKTWSIALERSTQLPQLVSELKRRYQSQDSFAFQEFHEPLPPGKPRPIPNLWPSMIGAFLLLLGLPLVFVTLSNHASDSNNDPPKNEPPEAFQNFIYDHFKTPEELDRFFLITGSVLSGLGLLSTVWGSVVLSRHSKQIQEIRKRELGDEARLTHTVILKSSRESDW